MFPRFLFPRFQSPLGHGIRVRTYTACHTTPVQVHYNTGDCVSSLPVSFEVGLVADERDWSVVAAQTLVLAHDVQVLGGVVETVAANDRVDDDERIRPLQVALRLLVRLHTWCAKTVHSHITSAMQPFKIKLNGFHRNVVNVSETKKQNVVIT